MNSTQIALNKKFFNVDSRYRASGSNTNFNYDLNIPFRQNFNSVSVQTVEIPKTYYMLDSVTNNVLNFEYPVATPQVATITSGRNYDASELAAELQTQMNAAVAGFTVSIDSNTGKFTITHSTGVFNITFATNPKLAKYLGFEQIQYTSNGSFVLTSVNYANLQRYDFLKIRSSIALNNNNDDLAIVYPASHGEGSIIRYDAVDTHLTSVGMANSRSNNFNFVLLDESNGVVNLNGGNWRILLVCSEAIDLAITVPQ